MFEELVSIVIYIHNDLQQLQRCLTNILRYTPEKCYELILVMEEENKKIYHFLKELPVKVICPDITRKYEVRWREGMHAATGKYVVFVQDYVMVTTGWLDSLQNQLLANSDVGIVMPIVGDNGGGEEYKDSRYASFLSLKIRPDCFMAERNMLEQFENSLLQYKTTYFGLAQLATNLLKQKKKIIECKNCFVLHEKHTKVFLADNIDDNVLYQNINGFSIGYSGNIRDDILETFDYKKPELKILEIGCACGATMMEIKNYNPSAHLYGMELNEAAAEIADNFGEVYTDNFENVDNPTFANYFDCIIMADVLEHLYDTDKSLQKVMSWLKPGGQLILSVPNVAFIGNVLTTLQGQWSYGESGILDKTHVRFFTFSSLSEKLKENGFVVRKLNSRQITDLPVDHIKLIDELVALESIAVDKLTLLTFQILCVAEKP